MSKTLTSMVLQEINTVEHKLHVLDLIITDEEGELHHTSVAFIIGMSESKLADKLQELSNYVLFSGEKCT